MLNDEKCDIKGVNFMNNTGFKDKNGKDILLGDRVLIDGEEYDVIINDFNQRIVVDSELGQGYLADIYMKCEVL